MANLPDELLILILLAKVDENLKHITRDNLLWFTIYKQNRMFLH